MQENGRGEERIRNISGSLKCAPTSARFKKCKDNKANYICHECGSPLCTECAEALDDRSVPVFNSGIKRLLFGIVALVALPVLTALLSNFTDSLSVVGGVFSGIIVGVAFITPLEILKRNDYNSRGENISTVKIVTRESTTNIHCRGCARNHKTETSLATGIRYTGIFLLILGIGLMVRGFVFSTSVNGFLFLSSFGYSLVIAKEALVELSLDYFPRLLKLQR